MWPAEAHHNWSAKQLKKNMAGPKRGNTSGDHILTGSIWLPFTTLCSCLWNLQHLVIQHVGLSCIKAFGLATVFFELWAKAWSFSFCSGHVFSRFHFLTTWGRIQTHMVCVKAENEWWGIKLNKTWPRKKLKSQAEITC